MKRICLPFASGATLAFAQSPAGVAVQMVVTVGVNGARAVPDLSRDQVAIFQGNDRLRITDWTALRGERGGLELFVLIDDACAAPLGGQLEDLRSFVRGLAATTSVGIGYARNGTADITQALTKGRGRAAAALRLPQGKCAFVRRRLLRLRRDSVAMSLVLGNKPGVEARRFRVRSE